MNFPAGGFSLDDAPRLGRQVEVDSNQSEILIENHQCSPTWEIADIFKISKSIKVFGENKKCVFYFMENN